MHTIMNATRHDAIGFEINYPDRQSWSSRHEEIEAALMSGAKAKKVIRDVNGVILGAIAYERVSGHSGDYYFIDHIGSLRKGVGTKLLQHVMRKAKKDKVPVKLVSSDEARAWYEKHKFIPSSEATTNLWTWEIVDE